MKIKSLYELLIAERETSGLHTSSGGVQKGFHRYYGFRNYYLLIESGQSIFKIRSDNLGLGWGNLEKILSVTLLQKCVQGHYGSVSGHVATSLTLGKYLI